MKLVLYSLNFLNYEVVMALQLAMLVSVDFAAVVAAAVAIVDSMKSIDLANYLN